MTHIDNLNRTFAERLGRPNGIDARFAWKQSTDIPYFHKLKDGSIDRKTWASRIGKCWLLCQWRPCDVSRETWAQLFGASLPYPTNGQYYPQAETALPRGMEPNDWLTEGYCRTISQQMEMTYKQHLEAAEADAQKYADLASQRFDDCVADQEPLSWKAGQPETPCTRGGCVSLPAVH
jgi:hypothetical protein